MCCHRVHESTSDNCAEVPDQHGFVYLQHSRQKNRSSLGKLNLDRREPAALCLTLRRRNSLCAVPSFATAGNFQAANVFSLAAELSASSRTLAMRASMFALASPGAF